LLYVADYSFSLEQSLSDIDFPFEIVTEASLGIEDGVVTTRSDADLQKTLIAEAGINARLLTYTGTPNQFY
jgi:hypothetical protein